jgi:tetratricopeptide (TPR) repeat protein
MSEALNTLAEMIPQSKRGGRFAAFLGHVMDWCVIGSVVLVPLWFLPATLDVLELNKQTLLLILVLIALVAWAGKAVLERSFSFTRSWLHLVAIGFLGGYAITTWFSADRYLSFVGNVGQMQWSFITVAAFVLLYFIVVNRFRSAGQVYDLALWFLLGSALAGIYGLLQMLGVHLIPGLAASNTFNTVGTVNALGVYMVIPTVLAASLTVLGCREKTCILSHESWKGKFWHGVVWATLAIGLLTAVAVDYWVIWAGLLFGDVLLVVLPFMRTRRFGHPVTLIVPGALALVSVLLLLFRTPLNLNLPSEVSPSLAHTWQIAGDTLRASPLFGSGPGTWIQDYAKYRSVGVNLSQFWNVRFERGLSAFFTMVAMLGIVGTALWLILVVSAIGKSVVHLTREKNDDLWQAYLTVFTAWMTLVFLAFIYNYNLAHHLAFWLLLGFLGVLVESGEWKFDQRSRPWVGTLLSVLFLAIAVAAISGTWLVGQRLAADIAYSSSVRSFQSGEDIQRSIDRLYTAVALNPLNDGYWRNLSQAELVKAGRLLQNNPDEAAGKQIRELVTAAVEHANRATALSPANVDNWSNLANVAQSIASFTRGADEQAIAAYGEALKREPNNPTFMEEIGKLHVLRADAYATLLQSPDAAAKKDAEANVANELNLAADWFNKAITAKPDYAAAHYDLGLVYERQGKVKDAVGKLEQVLAANPQDVGVAFQLATLYYRAGDKTSSRTLFEQIVQMVPDYANARWLLSAIYEEEGRYDDAIAQVEAVQKANPGDQNVAARLDALKKARDEKSKPADAPLPVPVKEEIKGPAENNPVQKP